MNSRGTFALNTTDDNFNERKNKVFDQLRVIEKNMRNKSISNSNDVMDTDETPNKTSQRSYTRHFRGKESIFKKPQNPVPKNYINKIPDFKKNPHKWTKYSLEDTEEVTEESNKRSAMTFLKELSDRKKIEDGINEEERMEELPTKIVFKKRSESFMPKGKVEEINDKPVESKNFKVVMPEYVIGQKNKKEKKIKEITKIDRGKELKLDHLLDNDEED